MVFEWCYKNQRFELSGKFQSNFEQEEGNFVRVSREFKLTK